MKSLNALIVVFFSLTLLACSTGGNSTQSKKDMEYKYGGLPVIQGATSGTATTFNIVVPRLKLKTLKAIVVEKGKSLPSSKEMVTDASIYTQPKTVSIIQDEKKLAHWGVKKFFFSGLKEGKQYQLALFDMGYYFKQMDVRNFTTLDAAKKKLRIAMASCMTDDVTFRGVSEGIWAQMVKEKPDILLFSGDVVYVDRFSFVKRNSATDLDIWLRFINTARTIPVYSQKRLTPILATWDDHDMVTNNSHRDTKNKEKALRAFQAFYGSEPIPGIYEKGAEGLYSVYKFAGQRIFLLDGRYFREEPVISRKTGQVLNESSSYLDAKTKTKHAKLGPYSTWGKKQHEWLMQELKRDKTPSWLVNGFQFFGETYLSERDGGKRMKRINESLMEDHKEHFKTLMADLKSVKAPVAFASGDIHFSEILQVEKDQLGYSTYEITASPAHSYVYGGEDELWPNRRRIAGKKDHNIVYVDSQVTKEKGLVLDVWSKNAVGRTLFSKMGLKIEMAQ